MPDFEFRTHPMTGKPVILAPRRSKRTNENGKKEAVCPFCIGQEANEEELYRVPALKKQVIGKHTEKDPRSENWQIRVIPNKFPFTPHHEIVIHSPDHHKNIDELPFSQVELIFQTYRERYNFHTKGPHFAKASRGKQVYIFHNRGHAAGESLPHPHTQLTVVPDEVKLDILHLDTTVYEKSSEICDDPADQGSILETDHFLLFCPETSDWPDEVWIAPKKRDRVFGQITDLEITDMAFVLSRVIQMLDIRHGAEFPFNFYIYPGRNWYLRLIPRLKILGGFEVGTNVIVNTQDPKETFAFLKEHFWKPDPQKIKGEHQAEYLKSV